MVQKLKTYVWIDRNWGGGIARVNSAQIKEGLVLILYVELYALTCLHELQLISYLHL